MLGATIDVLWTARYDYQSGWTLESHKHSYFQMIYFLNGRGRFEIGDSSLALRPGLVVLIKPGEVHSAMVTAETKTLDIKFRVRSAALRKHLLHAPSSGMSTDSPIPRLLERIRFEGEQRAPLYRDMCRGLMTEIALHYLRQQSGIAEHSDGGEEVTELVHDPLYRKTIDYIHRNYAGPMEIADIAKALGCCDRSLRQHFHNATGMRPLEYLQRFRLARAKELIEYSDYSLKDVAVRVGFQTVQHFTRRFTTAEGMTPAAWRQRYREGIRKDVCINPRFSNPNWTREGGADPPKNGA